MGKAEIISHDGDGQYTIKTVNDYRRIKAEIDRIEARIAAISGDDSAAAKIRRSNLQKKLARLRAIPETVTGSAWCADHTEDLTGNVGTAELARSGSGQAIILPGYGGNAVYSESRDGHVQNPLGNTAFQAYLNLCIYPAAARHVPRYRTGEIISIYGDTCDVRIGGLTVKGFEVNKTFTLQSVPISYMQCDGAVFDAGDRVLVHFPGGSWDSPEVIGFESNPKACVSNCYIYGEVVSIEGDYNTQDLRIYIKDLSNDLTPIKCVPSDWVEWAVGDKVIAYNWANCECSSHCAGDETIRQSGRFFELMNQIRTDVGGLRPLYYNRYLNEAAQAHLSDQMANCFQSHYGSDGRLADARIEDTGYKNIFLPGETAFSGATGENLAFAESPDHAFALWLESPGHYANIIRGDYDEMGLAVGRPTCDQIQFTSGLKSVPDNYYFYVNTFGRTAPPRWAVSPIEKIASDG